MSCSFGFTYASTENSPQRIWNMDLIWIKMMNCTHEHTSTDSFATDSMLKNLPVNSECVCVEQTKPKVIVTILICVNGRIENFICRLVAFPPSRLRLFHANTLAIIWIHKHTYLDMSSTKSFDDAMPPMKCHLPRETRGAKEYENRG